MAKFPEPPAAAQLREIGAAAKTLPAATVLWRYPSSMAANQPAVALFERARSALPAAPTFHRPLADPALITLLRNLAHGFGYGLV